MHTQPGSFFESCYVNKFLKNNFLLKIFSGNEVMPTNKVPLCYNTHYGPFGIGFIPNYSELSNYGTIWNYRTT